jgi:hypothetical protein
MKRPIFGTKELSYMVMIACHQDIYSAVMPARSSSEPSYSQIIGVYILAFVIFVECHENCEHAAIPNHFRV